METSRLPWLLLIADRLRERAVRCHADLLDTKREAPWPSRISRTALR
jgi:hypothetical protein